MNSQFAGVLPLVSESIALLRPSSVGSVSSSVITGKLPMVSSASLVIVFLWRTAQRSVPPIFPFVHWSRR